MKWLAILCCFISVAVMAEEPRTWTCVAHDLSNKKWVVKNVYQQIAVTKAMEACKRNSHMPLTCRAHKNSCDESGEQSASHPPQLRLEGLWECTALDFNAKPFNGDHSPTRLDAAIRAIDDCHAHSALPETCYLNFLTCNKK